MKIIWVSNRSTKENDQSRASYKRVELQGRSLSKFGWNRTQYASQQKLHTQFWYRILKVSGSIDKDIPARDVLEDCGRKRNAVDDFERKLVVC